MAIADTSLEALMLTSLWVSSLIGVFVLGVYLEHKRMKKKVQEPKNEDIGNFDY